MKIIFVNLIYITGLVVYKKKGYIYIFENLTCITVGV